MRTLTIILSFLLASSLFAQYTADENFDKDWRFFNNIAEGAEQTDFDDAEWRQLNLPHDWAIEGPFSKEYDCRMGALPVHGTGWYRKHFTMPKSAKGKVVRIEFEGAMYNSVVWVNGEKVGHRPYGYIGFEFDISKYLKYDGSDNVIAVRLTPEDYSSRWYPGAGLYRSVWLKVDEPVYVDMWGSYVTTPTVTPANSVVQHEVTVVNKSKEDKTVTVNHQYFDANGTLVAKNKEEIVAKAGEKTWSGVFTNIKEAKMWNVYEPNLYTVKTTITEGEKVLDTYEQRFGVRKIKFDADNFYINDKKIRFNGVNLHHDNGALGATVYKRADERKLEIMKDMGVNAIRCSHNPPSREFLEVCDEMGIVVIDESYDCWAIAKIKNGYNVMFEEWGERDLEDMVIRDRSHPSVIMWSIGNEIKEQWQPTIGWKVAKRLNAVVKQLDTSRPTTCGFNSFPTAHINNMAQQVDIAGSNYKPTKYSYFKEVVPDVPIYGSETSGVASTRGVYHFPVEKYQKHESLQVTSYDIVGPRWVYPPDVEFYFQEKNPEVLGEFIWTGVDYLGETSPYGGLDNIDNTEHWNSDYPSRSSYFGAVDLAGFPKDRFYRYQAQWTTEPMVHVMPHWNLDKEVIGETIPVYAYTNCEEAELFINGKSMGRKVKGQDKANMIVNFLRYEPKSFDSPYSLRWDVEYQPGEVKIVGYNDGKAITEKTLKTAGKPAKIKLSVDRSTIDADGRDLSYVTVEIQDKEGNFCPLANNQVYFDVNGAGKIVGVGNGNPTSLESFQDSKRKVFNGLALVILNSNEGEAGTISLKAKSKGLKSASIVVETK